MNLAYRLILASKSPRRKELLDTLDIPFQVETYPIEEDFPEALPPEEVAEFLAIKKAKGFRQLQQSELLLTSDTTVILNAKILGKPANRTEAIAMLTALSGTRHAVVSGVCLTTSTRQVSFSEKTAVNFRRLNPDEIEYYVDQYHPFDKAGAYGIQEWIGKIGITSIEGDYYNVVGLPLQSLYRQLQSNFSA